MHFNLLKPIVKTIIVLSVFYIVAINANCQQAAPSPKPLKSGSFFKPFLFDTGLNRTHYATRQQIIAMHNLGGAVPQGVQDCQTSTFYMHIPVQSGQKISLQTLQTLPGGDYFAAGSIVAANKNTQGLVLRISNTGNIVLQKKMLVNGSQASITSAKVLVDGTVLVGGVLRNGTNAAFAALLNTDLSLNWLKAFPMPSNPITVKVDVTDGAQFSNGVQYTIGVQLAASVVCIMLNNNQTLAWSTTVTPAGLISLAALSNTPEGAAGLVTNCLQNGRRVTEFTELAQINGKIASDNIVGSDESNFCQVNIFNGRLKMAGVFKTSNSFGLERNFLFNSKTIETHHTYQLAASVDFGTSIAMDNAGDAIGACLPKDGKLVFIRQFADYQTTPEYTRQYSVPNAGSMAGVARSFDGGYLFGLNSKDSGEVVLIKTDSIGIIAGCGYNNMDNNFTELLQIANNAGTTATANTLVAATGAAATFTDAVLTPTFDCKQNYCPAAPTQDSCLSTYYKVLRTNSYIDAFDNFYVMRNNMQIGATVRYDRVVGDYNTLTYGLKLFDEKGNFVKGVDVLSNGVASGPDSRQMDDKTIMLNSYSTNNGIPQFTFTLVSDDLTILWSKTITCTEFGASSDGTGAEDWLKDADGNYYFVTCGAGFYSPSKLYALKMDGAGNVLWTKGYACNSNQNFASVSATVTQSSLLLIIDAYSGKNATVRLDKATGQFANSFFYENGGGDGGLLHHRRSKYSNGRVLYVGNNKENLLLGTFDSTGKPVKLKSVNQASISFAGAVSNKGIMYNSYGYFDGQKAQEVLLKVDTGLNVLFASQFALERPRGPRGLGIGENGYIFEAGNYFHGGLESSYYDPYLIKYDSTGKLGNCSNKIPQLPLTDIDPQTQVNTDLMAISSAIQTNTVPIEFVPDNDGPAVADLVCSSQPQCSFIKIVGPVSLCKLDTAYNFTMQKNALCTVTPAWVYDTAFAAISNITDTAVSFSFKKTGNILLKATLNEGCNLYSDSILVKVQKAPAQFTLGNDKVLCPADSLVLHAGGGFNSYLWQNGSNDSSFTVTLAGQYSVQVSNVCGDKYTDTVLVSAAVTPPLAISNNKAVCLGDTLFLQATAGFAVYNWSPTASIIGQGQQVGVAPTLDLTVRVNAITADGCNAVDSAAIIVKQARGINLGGDTSFCSYDSLVLNAGVGYTKYLWGNGTTGPSITIKQAGSYWVIAQDTNGCYSHDTIVVNKVYNAPVVNLGNYTSLCYGDSLVLDAGRYASYVWQDGSTNRFYTARAIGGYYVTVTDNNNCTGKDSIRVVSILPLPGNFLTSMDSICQFDNLVIQPKGNFSEYIWSNGSTQTSITVSTAGIYTLTVKNSNGCTGSDTITVIVNNCGYGFFIPNAFTPNGDGHNDVFKPRIYGNVLSYHLRIYNRFGEMIFNTADPKMGWDGTYKGLAQDRGAYVWQCSYLLQGSPAAYEKGTVILIR